MVFFRQVDLYVCDRNLYRENGLIILRLYYCYHDITCIILGFTLIPGESILSGQFSNLTIETEVNISLIPDRYSDVVMEYFMSKNITVVDNLTNISSNSLCPSAATRIRDILTTFTSIEISCDPECGQKFSAWAYPLLQHLRFSVFFYACRN